MIRFLTDTFIDEDTNLVAYEFSSEDADFPAENVLNRNRRSKVWRTAGYFEIESGSNTIVFSEDGGSTPLTATITADEYTSNAAFRAAVKAALEAASVNSVTYTVAHTNSKFVITSNGNGGATLDLLWTDAGSTDMADILGYSDASDDSGALTYTADVIRIHTSEWITFDLGTAANPTDFILVGGDRNAALPISPGATIYLYGSPVNNFNGVPPVSYTLTYNDEAVYTSNNDGLDTAMSGARFWRVEIVDRDNANGYIELGAVFLGNHAFTGTDTRGCAQFPFNFSPIDRSDVIFSEGGQNFSDKNPQAEDFSLTFSALEKEEAEILVDIFRDYGKVTPFFLSLDQNQVFSTSVNRWIRYVQFQGEPSLSLTNPNFFTMQAKFLEVL